MKVLQEKKNSNQQVRGLIRQFSAGALMMISSGQIIYAFLCQPDTLPKSYFSFLLTHSGLREIYGAKAKDVMILII